MQPMAELPLSFESFLAPLAPQEFFARYWAERHVRLKGEGSSRHRELFSIADIDRYLALACQNPATHISIISADKPVERTRSTDVELSRVYTAFHSGSTLLLEGTEQVWPPLFRLAQMLRGALGADIKINIYVSPSGSQGAHLHPDINDVFALQLEGSKRWWLYQERVHEPVEGLKFARYLTDRRQQFRFEREDVEIPLAEELILEPGDLLYMPRGVVHKAATTEGTPSLHLAIVVAPTYWIEVLEAAVEVAAAHHPELCRGLPPGFEAMDTATLAADLRERFQQALAILAAPGVLERALEIVQSTRMARAIHVGDGHFEQLVRLDELTPATWIERRAGQHCLVTAMGTSASIRFGATQVNGPAQLAQALRFIRDHQRFRVADLPGPLDDGSKLVLVKRLIREGLLRMAQEPGPAGADPAL